MIFSEKIGRMLLVTALLVSCRHKADKTDDDGDGVMADVDCDDSNAAIGGPSDWYPDADADGHGVDTAALSSCFVPEGHVSDSLDCDDASAAIHPGAAEEDCTDPVDYNCDGSTGFEDADKDGSPACKDCDDDDDVTDPAGPTWHADLDSDGFGGSQVTTVACEAPEGYVGNVEDCDDLDATANPDGTETCDKQDNDCNGTIDDSPTDEKTFYADADGDTWGDELTTDLACEAPEGFVDRAGDCADDAPARHPFAAEVDCADKTDYNCDGNTGYADVDADGFAACKDCDDTVATVNTAGTEVCNDVDDDCDGTVDDNATDATVWFGDIDGDDHGGTRFSETACDAPAGFVTSQDDCDDLDNTAFPGAPEVCDGADDDCSGIADDNEPAGKAMFYADADVDGFGDPLISTSACVAPAGYVANALDCDDADATVAPARTFYGDVDGDKYGSIVFTTQACTVPPSYSAVSGDCNDAVAAIYPGAPEYCDNVDHDCDGAKNETTSLDTKTWYVDSDNDKYGGSTTSKACTQPSGSVAVTGDCNDAVAATYPTAPESCDAVDSNCNGSLVDTFANFDGDSQPDCTDLNDDNDPDPDTSDCNDANAAIYTGATEITCNGIDENCDGSDTCSDPCINYGGTALTISTNVKVCNTPLAWGTWNPSLIPGGWQVCNLSQWAAFAPSSTPRSLGLETLWINNTACGSTSHREVYVDYPMNQVSCYDGNACCWDDSTVLRFAICR